MSIVLVAGHICLDIIPEFKANASLEPGCLVETGPALVGAGGAVSNTGLALRKLGVDARLVGKVGEGVLGRALLEILESHSLGASQWMLIDPEHATSYTVVLNLSGYDRTFLHCPGVNETFCSGDVSNEALAQASWLHIGYPPLLRRMYESNGEQLLDLLQRAKAHSLTTSLDLSLPDPASESSRVDWRRILARCLPHVDFFLPSYHELLFMLEPTVFEAKAPPSQATTDRLLKASLDMGGAHVAVKAGVHGFHLRIGAGAPTWPSWRDQTIRSPAFQVDAQGATGAGDAAIAGFIAAVLKGKTPPEAAQIACAVGAFCCERPDAVTGIPTWSALEDRLNSPWPTYKLS